MATGRTVAKFLKCYVDGYDMSGYTRSIGPLALTYAEQEDRTYGNQIVGALPGQVMMGIGTLSTALDNTATSGPHVLFSGLGASGAKRTVMLAVGVRATPAQGDPVFAGEFEQLGYVSSPSEAVLSVDMPFAASGRQTSLLYDNAWGDLLHANSAATAANSAVGIDNPMGASTAFGGYMVYQVTAGDGTATIKVQDAGTNSDGSFSDLASSGSIDCSTVQHGLVALSATATVARYLRWQIALGTATTVTFALSFHRAYH